MYKWISIIGNMFVGQTYFLLAVVGEFDVLSNSNVWLQTNIYYYDIRGFLEGSLFSDVDTVMGK